MTLARVFPRRTKATPTDEYAFTMEPGLFVPEDVDETGKCIRGPGRVWRWGNG